MKEIRQKIALYEFCRRRVGKEYYNLSSKRKESIMRQYLKLKEMQHPAVDARYN